MPNLQEEHVAAPWPDGWDQTVKEIWLSILSWHVLCAPDVLKRETCVDAALCGINMKAREGPKGSIQEPSFGRDGIIRRRVVDKFCETLGLSERDLASDLLAQTDRSDELVEVMGVLARVGFCLNVFESGFDTRSAL